MTFPEPPENLPSDAAVAEVRSRLVADGVIPGPMPDQTPEPAWPLGDLTPGTYTLTSTGDGPGDAVITDDGRILVEQFEGDWRDLTFVYRSGVSWEFERREPHPAAPDPTRARVAELEAGLEESRRDVGAARGYVGALQARVMELQSQVAARDARIAELEAAQTPREPDAYIAVKRYFAVSAEGPEWEEPAKVFPAGEEWRVEREEFAAEGGWEFLPIVADGDGTRAVTAQAVPREVQS